MFDAILSHVWTLEREKERIKMWKRRSLKESISRELCNDGHFMATDLKFYLREDFSWEKFSSFFRFFFTAKKQQIVVARIRMKLELRIFSIIHTNSMHDERVHLMTLINLSCQSSDFVILVQVLVRFKLSYYDKWVLKIRIPINYRESTQFLTSDSEGRQMYS